MQPKKNNQAHLNSSSNTHTHSSSHSSSNFTTFRIFKSSNIQNERIIATKYTNAD